MARPGEFTERAFLNGRMDLAQAEGVANLVAARTREAGRAALAQLGGALSDEIGAIYDVLIDAGAEIEAQLDFSEEEVEPADVERLGTALSGASIRLERLMATARRGRLLRDGARVVIAGKPNTGKSSLFNALVGMERALVTPHPGTTRDTIEATLDLRGMPIVLIDTAGVRRESAEEIESLGIERARREVEAADLVLFVVDGSSVPDGEDAAIHESLTGAPHLLLVNKSDLARALDDDALADRFAIRDAAGTRAGILRISALEPETLGPLEGAIAAGLVAEGGAADRETPTVTNQRHVERLGAAHAALERARKAFDENVSGELVMVDLNDALHALSEILGLTLDDAVLSRIFERFCIGK